MTNTPNKFWSRINIKNNNECWEWTGCILNDGYGQIRMDWKKYRTHRLAWELTHGIISDELQVLHKCDNRKCCNPNHLFLGTHQDNMNDMTRKERQAKGIKNFKSKLNEKQVKEIRNLYLSGKYSQRQLGKMYNVKHCTIGRIINKINWK